MRKTNALRSSSGHRAIQHPGRAQDVDPLRGAREKITRVFRYLEALNQHRNPVQRQLSGQQWSLWLHDLPRHTTVQRGAPDTNTDTHAAQREAGRRVDQDKIENFVIKVRRPKLNPAPEPPREIAAWLKSGWDEPSNDARFKETVEHPEENGTSHEKFHDSPNRPAAFQRWQLE